VHVEGLHYSGSYYSLYLHDAHALESKEKDAGCYAMYKPDELRKRPLSLSLFSTVLRSVVFFELSKKKWT
jgi:hypothetical protein